MSKIITTEQAAAHLGTSARRVQQLARELSLEPLRVGRVLIFSERDLKRMQARKTRRGPAKKGAVK